MTIFDLELEQKTRLAKEYLTNVNMKQENNRKAVKETVDVVSSDNLFEVGNPRFKQPLIIKMFLLLLTENLSFL